MTEQADEEDDPFEQLESDVADREGNPFADLDAGVGSDDSEWGRPTSTNTAAEAEEQTATDGEVSPRSGDDDQFDSLGFDTSTATPDGQANESDPDGAAREASPESSQMGFGVGRNAGPGDDPLGDAIGRGDDPFESGGAFEHMEMGDLDPDEVWQDLASAESRGSVGDATERTYADVSKHSFCQQCEHFSPPPAVVCGHEGTEIVEFVDMERVRVVDCPVVAEREALQEQAMSAAESTQRQ